MVKQEEAGEMQKLAAETHGSLTIPASKQAMWKLKSQVILRIWGAM
jgi:hypothetical protein